MLPTYCRVCGRIVASKTTAEFREAGFEMFDGVTLSVTPCYQCGGDWPSLAPPMPVQRLLARLLARKSADPITRDLALAAGGGPSTRYQKDGLALLAVRDRLLERGETVLAAAFGN